MSNNIPPPPDSKKLFHQRSDSGELDVFEAARYFSGAIENFTCTHNRVSDGQKDYMKQSVRRMSLDMPTNRGNSIPLQAMMMETNPNMIKKEKYKQPSSPGGKLAHFLNSLFNQTSSKKSKSKSKSTTTTQSMKDEDESPSGWRRKRRSSISHFRSGNSNFTTTTTTIVSDSKTLSSNSKPTSYPTHKPTCEITKIPINGNLNRSENFKIKVESCDKKRSLGDGIVGKMRVCEEKHGDKVKDFKKFSEDDDDGGDSDSSSDLFELRNCDLGYYTSGLPVYETTHMDSIKRGVPISS